ncbi:hypothetical protein PAMP_021344 [Pampus punctatissimus]
MCTAVDNREIIILSDDDDEDCEQDVSCSEPSVVIVEVEDVKSDCMLPPSALDEDLVVTFSRPAEVLPHARYDCPIHPFTATDYEINAPLAGNQLICDQCFCYICDKLASSCVMWCHSGVCHCNSHKRSDFWKDIRNSTLLGGLKTFNLTLSEIDAHLRQAEMMLQCFRRELTAQFSSYLEGKRLEEYGLSILNHQGLIHETFILQSSKANVAEAKAMLLQRIVASLQRQMLLVSYCNFTFVRSSLCVRPWDDILLVSVLKGQNLLGFRKDKGKRDILTEQISVVLLRTELLQHQHRYRELCRYLQVVQTDKPSRFQEVQDLIPFFTCMEGNFTSALQSLPSSVNGTASRFTPSLFLVYLRIFETATAPQLTVSQPMQLCYSHAEWKPIKDAVPLKRAELVKFALRVQRCCSAVYTDNSKDVVYSILLDQSGSMHIPRAFQQEYPDQALLLLITGALGLRILAAALSPSLPVLNTLKDNAWALRWLWENLSSSADRCHAFVQEIEQELKNITDGENVLHFLQPIVSTLSSSAKDWDQQPGDD